MSELESNRVGCRGRGVNSVAVWGSLIAGSRKGKGGGVGGGGGRTDGGVVGGAGWGAGQHVTPREQWRWFEPLIGPVTS